MRDGTLITTPDELEAAVFRLQGARRLAIDTEFMRERTYYARLCLVQVASDADCFLVDALAGLELDALFEVLLQRSRPKILHAARQDLEVICNASGKVPGPVFDTQVAAALLGLSPQLGYADLVARQLGHSIDKAQTRTDWSRRPLTPAQLAYAADDVHHLLELHDALGAALEAQGRAAWLVEDCAALEDPGLYRTEPAEAWRRLRGLGRIRPREQAAARALAAWRERRAIDADKPRGWILADDALLAIATRQPRSRQELEQVPALPPALVRKSGDDLLALVEEAVGTAEDLSPVRSLSRPSATEARRIAELQQRVREVAAGLGINPEVLATRRDVEALVIGPREASALARGWRREVLGEELLALPG